MIKWTILFNMKDKVYRFYVGTWIIPGKNELVLMHGKWSMSEYRYAMREPYIVVWFSAQHSCYYISNKGRTNSKHDHVANIFYEVFEG